MNPEAPECRVCGTGMVSRPNGPVLGWWCHECGGWSKPLTAREHIDRARNALEPKEDN